MSTKKIYNATINQIMNNLRERERENFSIWTLVLGLVT
jgi:hypothetical protein